MKETKKKRSYKIRKRRRESGKWQGGRQKQPFYPRSGATRASRSQMRHERRDKGRKAAGQPGRVERACE